jgi:hypothetical protein
MPYDFAAWPTATAVVYFLGIYLYYSMSMALIHVAVELDDSEGNYVVHTYRLVALSMFWPVIVLSLLATQIFDNQ